MIKRSAGLTLLSPRQREILRLRERGKVVKEIAAELDISASTVKFHLSGAFRRLRAKSTTEALYKLRHA
ncbi:MAG: LuxR C-terminal-related transcriptional regulator [Verrucomicrobiota bacterium]